MVDLQSQYLKIKNEIDNALIRCAKSARYIKGPEVRQFEENLADYLDVNIRSLRKRYRCTANCNDGAELKTGRRSNSACIYVCGYRRSNCAPGFNTGNGRCGMGNF